MSDPDTISPETDDEIRARLQAFAQEVKERTDTEAALQRMPRRSRPPTLGLAAVAACFILAVAIAAVVIADRQSVDTVPPSESPTTECPTPTQPRAITPGGQMNKKFAAPVASAATAVMLLGACSDDGPTTLAKGEDVELVGDNNIGGQTLNISAEEEDGKATGELRFTDVSGEVVVTVECADTDTEGLVILGGTIAEAPDELSGMIALFIREGDPDSVEIWADENAESCTELLETAGQDVLADDSTFVDVEAGSDIETG